MTTLQLEYQGDLRVKAIHTASQASMQTDAPVDNQGKGQSFSPTDTVCLALGSCMMTIMGIAANTHQISLQGLSADVTKHMASDPRRIIAIDINFYGLDVEPTEHQKVILERAARTCPVALSLHPDIEQRILFSWA